MNIRMLGPVALGMQTRSFNGRTYSAGAGQPLTVPDFDAGALEANGWTRVAATGPTSSRPVNITGAAVGIPQTPLFAGLEFFDETLGYLIRYDGATWRSTSTGAAV